MRVKYPTPGKLPQPTKPFSSITLEKQNHNDQISVIAQVLSDRLVDDNGMEIKNAAFGLALDGSSSMMDVYGAEPAIFAKDGINYVDVVAKSLLRFLANYAMSKSVYLAYWAVGLDGKEVEDVGNISYDKIDSIKIKPQKTMGKGTYLLPIVKYFVEDKLNDALWSMVVIVTDGLIDDLIEVENYTERLAQEVYTGKRNNIKLVLIGLGEEVDVSQLERLDDFEASVDVDIWSSKLASEMNSLHEVFDEVMSENFFIAPAGKIIDNQGLVLAEYKDGLPSRMEFKLKSNSISFKVLIPGQPPVEQNLSEAIKLLTKVTYYVINGPVPEEIFFGREKELQQITMGIPNTSFTVIGGRRIGKSSLLKYLHRHYIHLSNFNSLTLYFDCSIALEYQKFPDTQIHDWMPKAPINAPKTFGELLKSPPKNTNLILLLDEADKLVHLDKYPNSPKFPLFNAFRALSNTGLAQFIFCGEYTILSTIKDTTSPFFNFTNEIILGPLSYQAVYELVTIPMKKLKFEIIDEDKVVEKIFSFTGGHPNVIQRLCHRLVSKLNEGNEKQVTIDKVRLIIKDRDFLKDDFLTTYWESSSILEKIISILMVKYPKIHSLKSLQNCLANKYKIHLHKSAIRDGLQRLVNLRSILCFTENGNYDFSLRSFKEAISMTLTIDDILDVLIEELKEINK